MIINRISYNLFCEKGKGICGNFGLDKILHSSNIISKGIGSAFRSGKNGRSTLRRWIRLALRLSGDRVCVGWERVSRTTTLTESRQVRTECIGNGRFARGFEWISGWSVDRVTTDVSAHGLCFGLLVNWNEKRCVGDGWGPSLPDPTRFRKVLSLFEPFLCLLSHEHRLIEIDNTQRMVTYKPAYLCAFRSRPFVRIRLSTGFRSNQI